MFPTPSRRSFMLGTAATAAFPWRKIAPQECCSPSPVLAGLIDDLRQAHVVLDAAFARVRELSAAGKLTNEIEDEITDPPWDAKDAIYARLMAYQPGTWADFAHKMAAIDRERNCYDGSLVEEDTETIFADCARLSGIGGVA